MILHTSEEIEKIASSFGIDTENRTLQNIKEAVLLQLPDIFRKEREKLTHKGFAHNKGNRIKFVDYLKANIKDIVSVTEINYDGYTLVRFKNFSSLEVYDEQIRMDNCWKNLGMGLHSGFFDEIIQFLFDEKGIIQQVYQKYKSLDDTLQLISQNYTKIVNEDNVKKALSSEAYFLKLYESYQGMIENMQSIQKYVSFKDWNESLKILGIDPSLKTIEQVKRLIEGRIREKSKRYEKRYKESQQVLIGAKNHGLLRKSEWKEIKPWEQLVSELTNEEMIDQKRDNYLSSISQIYTSTLKACDFSGTSYMQKKKSKILADMEICKQIKELCGADCFIDRSAHKNTVYHVNFVLNENQVLVFRIGKNTPSLDTCMRFAHISMAIDEISRQLSKAIKLQIIDSKKINTYWKEIEKLEEGKVERPNNTHISISLPMGSMCFRISLKYQKADCSLKQFMPLINKYREAYGDGNDIDIKGIFKERTPNL